ncbi:MAG: MBL fold metallo-hydrolase, partial [Desulfuromonadales bacterium]|nr:MBL fold metallo-hydrolase [Desulfuromonadales bacterium]
MIPEVVQIPIAGTDNFSYLVICPQTGKALGIDPGVSPESLLNAIRSRELSLQVLANTHGHPDHIAGNAEVLRVTGAKLAANLLDVPKVDISLNEGSELQIGAIAVDVLHTPGHTPGSLVFNPPGALITGDTLFVTRCGRADFSGSDPAALYHSLLRLAAFPPDTQVFPGHNYGPKPQSTIAFEREHNEYMKCPDLESFLKLRMG